MRLAAEEKHCLEELYLYHNVAIDQLRRAPLVLKNITDAFCSMTGRDCDAATLHRYMMNRRKNADWPKLGAKARKFPGAAEEFAEDELTLLESLYIEVDETSDELLLSPKIAKEVSLRFAKETGRIVPGPTLVAAIFQRRKRRAWARIRAGQPRAAQPAPFSDISIVAKQFRHA